MARADRTTRFVKQMHEHLVAMDLDTATSGYLLSRTADYAQRALADVIFSVLNQWATAYGSVPATHPLNTLYEQSRRMIDALNGSMPNPEKSQDSVLTMPV